MGGGDVVHSDAPSYVMAIQGNFAVGVHRPPVGLPGTVEKENETSTYSVMTIVVDAATGRVTDFGLAHCMPDLSVAGPMTTLMK
jgi:hypothetical protein